MDNIIADIIKIVSGFILGILSTPIKNWIKSTHKEVCAYEKDKKPNPSLKEIVITEKFGKTSHINCYWFNRREETNIDGIKYLHCFYGEKFLSPNGIGGARCPFIK
jgi:hypothetical protein